MIENYYRGAENRLIRWYFYIQNGAGVLSQFRTLVELILGVGLILKFTSIYAFFIPVMPCVAILGLAGWYNVHKMSKMVEYLNTSLGSHYSIRTFDIINESLDTQKKSRELLEKILAAYNAKN